jgi:2-polyprenyl-3-methyl-5-hydroxy-6-metoxy-1,4-benzoquinol methylase
VSEGVEERERAFFDRHYREVARNPVGFDLRVKRELAALRRATGGRRLGRILSVGCGDGPFECLLASHADAVLGIDVSEAAIERACERAKAAGLANVEFRCQAASALDPGERFDGVACVAFLHHVPEADVPGLLSDLRKRLSPGGFLFAQEPSRRAALRTLGHAVLGSGYGRYHSPDERELDPDELTAQLRDAGFGSVEIGWIDVTLIPGQYVFPRAPAALMHAFAAFDRLFCATGFAHRASSFTAFATKGEETR